MADHGQEVRFGLVRRLRLFHQRPHALGLHFQVCARRHQREFARLQFGNVIEHRHHAQRGGQPVGNMEPAPIAQALDKARLLALRRRRLRSTIASSMGPSYCIEPVSKACRMKSSNGMPRRICGDTALKKLL